MANNTKVVTGKVRFSYAHVFKPAAAANGGSEKYSCSLLIPKTDEVTVNRVKEAIRTAVQEGVGKFGGKVPPMATLHLPLRDGDAERPDDPAYKGMYFVNANSNRKPAVVDAGKDPILDESEFYSGCWGRASINFYAYNNSGNKGIACGLNALQKLKDDEPLGGVGGSAKDFDDDFKDEDDDEFGI